MAAYHGRVDKLFVAVGVQVWGTADPESGEVYAHESMEPGDEDLLDVAATRTLVNDGDVYAVEPERIPNGAPLAATFRY